MEQTHSLGVRIWQGLEQGGVDTVVVLYGGFGAVMLFGLLLSFAIWWINDRRQKRAEFARLRVRTLIEVDGIERAFDLKEAA